MNIGSWFETWVNVLIRPGEVTMEDERAEPQAKLSTALIWLTLLAIITGIVSWIQAAIFANRLAAAGGIAGIAQQAMQAANLPPDQVQAINEALAQMPAGVPFLSQPQAGLGALLMSIVSTIIGFLIGVAILQVVAKVLGGTGNFGKYAYLLAAIYIPIGVINALLGFIPLLGGCLGLLLGIYALFLAYYATRVEHKLSSGRSIIVILTPWILGAIAACCGLTVFGGIIAAIFAGQ